MRTSVQAQQFRFGLLCCLLVCAQWATVSMSSWFVFAMHFFLYSCYGSVHDQIQSRKYADNKRLLINTIDDTDEITISNGPQGHDEISLDAPQLSSSAQHLKISNKNSHRNKTQMSTANDSLTSKYLFFALWPTQMSSCINYGTKTSQNLAFCVRISTKTCFSICNRFWGSDEKWPNHLTKSSFALSISVS